MLGDGRKGPTLPGDLVFEWTQAESQGRGGDCCLHRCVWVEAPPHPLLFLSKPCSLLLLPQAAQDHAYRVFKTCPIDLPCGSLPPCPQPRSSTSRFVYQTWTFQFGLIWFISFGGETEYRDTETFLCGVDAQAEGSSVCGLQGRRGSGLAIRDELQEVDRGWV